MLKDGLFLLFSGRQMSLTNRLGILIFALFVTALPGSSSAGDAVSVTFSLSAPRAASVTIAGSFNQWDPVRDALLGPDRSGNWTITLRLAPGRYEYLFLINDREWTPDPRAPSADDGMGGRNSVVLVGAKQ